MFQHITQLDWRFDSFMADCIFHDNFTIKEISQYLADQVEMLDRKSQPENETSQAVLLG
jgi:hypothetical protein